MSELFSVLASDGHTVHGSLVRAKSERGATLLIHGITSDRHEWGFFDALSDELCVKGISTIAIDYRGHGESNMPTERLSLSGILLDIMAAWKHLNEISTARRKVILGNSFGGGLAFLFGALDAEIHLTIATCPVLSYIADISRANPDWPQEVDSGTVRYVSKRLPASIIAEMWAYDELIRLAPTPRRCAIFHGMSDSDVPYSESEEFAKRRVKIDLKGLRGMDHSFSAPEGVPNREEKSKLFRVEAAKTIAAYIARSC